LSGETRKFDFCFFILRLHPEHPPFFLEQFAAKAAKNLKECHGAS
jgi:hypothetical protein